MLNVMKVLRETIEAEYDKLLSVPLWYLNDEGTEMKDVLCKLYYACNTSWPEDALKNDVFSLTDIKFKDTKIMIARVKGMLVSMDEQEKAARRKMDREAYEAFLKEQGDSDEYIQRALERFDREENHD